MPVYDDAAPQATIHIAVTTHTPLHIDYATTELLLIHFHIFIIYATLFSAIISSYAITTRYLFLAILRRRAIFVIIAIATMLSYVTLPHWYACHYASILPC